MATTKKAEDLAVGDIFTAPADILGGGTFTVKTVEKRRNVPSEMNTYETEHDKMYLDVERNGTEHHAWLWPHQEIIMEAS